ncbi:hypothetical protein, partial [Rikenella microfusus]|uniref:hypothetical protein n=1 Tax=Rikenella microfusus TaxID=28139 RepID=UPI003AB4C869
ASGFATLLGSSEKERLPQKPKTGQIIVGFYCCDSEESPDFAVPPSTPIGSLLRWGAQSRKSKTV